VMSVDDVKFLYGLACFGLGLIVVSPTVVMFVSFPGGEPFSELWLLGEGHMAEGYPFDVRENETYRVYLGVGNHMGLSEYYRVHVKFRNQSESLPDVLSGTPSALPPLFEYRFFVGEKETWETLVAFSFSGVSVEGNVSRVSGVTVDGVDVFVDKAAVWDSEGDGYLYQLFFELWLYDVASSGFRFHDRFVGLWLNMTVS
jgi:hypothetical protein